MTIVVGVDGSEAAAHALAWATVEARRRGAALRLVHAWTYAVGGHAAVADTLTLLADASRSLLDRLVCEARASAPDLDITGVTVQHAPARALLEASAGAELLVVGSRGHGAFSAFFVGSVADACVRHARVPVVVLRPEAVEHERGAIVVGIDGSAASLEALRWARREAEVRGADVVALHAWQPAYATELAATFDLDQDAGFERAAHDVAAGALDATAGVGVEPRVQVVRDLGGPALVDASRHAALLVVGARGHGGFAELLLGSVSRRCVHAATCPVVVVHDPRPG